MLFWSFSITHPPFFILFSLVDHYIHQPPQDRHEAELAEVDANAKAAAEAAAREEALAASGTRRRGGGGGGGSSGEHGISLAFFEDVLAGRLNGDDGEWSSDDGRYGDDLGLLL